MTEWFEQWFGEAYLKLYPHRDEEEAALAVALIEKVVGLRGRTVLDLACGPGRHAIHLKRAGARVTGFDLSLPLLSRARHRGDPPLSVVRGDMRQLPFGEGTFDLVVNLFTSFGYFSTDLQHEQVLSDVAFVLKQGGVLVLDYFNSSDLRDSLVEHEERAVGGQQVIIDRRITDDGRYVIKEMHLVHDGRSFLERVRLYEVEDLESLMVGAGITVRHSFGDYTGTPVSCRSPRVLLVGEKT